MGLRTTAKAAWQRVKNWVVGLLVAIGLIVIPPAIGGSKDFSWTNPTQYTDGTALDPATDLKEIRIYCSKDGQQVPVIVVPSPATNYTATLSTGTYQCYATAVSVEDQESFASNSVTFTVDPLIPNPPVLVQ